MDEKEVLEELLQDSIEESAKVHLDVVLRDCTPEIIAEQRAGFKAKEKELELGVAAVIEKYGLDALYAKGSDLTGEERERVTQGDLERRTVFLEKKQAVADYLENEMVTPYRRMYGVTYALAQAQTEHPDENVLDLFEKLDKPEEDKLMTLYYLREFAAQFGIPDAQMRVDAANGKQPDRATIQRLSDFAIKYGTGRPAVDEKGEFTMKKDVYTETHNDMVAAMIGALGGVKEFSGKSGAKGQDKVHVRNNYMRLKDFCDKGLRRMHIEKLRTGSMVQNDPYFNPESASYRRSRESLDNIRKTHAMNQSVKETALSFGRKGSPQFQDMKASFERFRELLQKHGKNPTPESYRALAEQYKQLEQRTETYLDFKQEQMRKGEIGSKMERQSSGKMERVPTNSNTRKRMDFAKEIQKGLLQLRDYIQKGLDAPQKQEAHNRTL